MSEFFIGVYDDVAGENVSALSCDSCWDNPDQCHGCNVCNSCNECNTCDGCYTPY